MGTGRYTKQGLQGSKGQHMDAVECKAGALGTTLLNYNLTWQFSFQANVFITRIFYISAGYRKYYLDFSVKESFFSGSLQGAVVKFGFQF